MPEGKMPATEGKNRVGPVLRAIAQTGGPIVPERDGKPVAVILGIEAAVCLRPQDVQTAKGLDAARAAFGLWVGGKAQGKPGR